MNQALRKYLDEQAEELDRSVQDALTACNGNPTSALRAMVIANTFLMEENEKLKAQISTGYARQTVRKAEKIPPRNE
jgi:regulator of replication initiation timing